MSKLLSFLLLSSLLILASCATQVPPSGGPKDTTPPQILKMDPPNKSTLFSKKKVVIKFDEFIQLQNINSQLVVSPAMPSDPDISVQGKNLIIKIPDSLEDNTTYTVFLGDAVVNYKEGLAVKQMQYVLATGKNLDSLRISGTIKNAFDLSTEEGVIVMLYKEAEDSIPMKKRPYYIGKTFGSGSFILDNLSAGSYKIFALKDLNSNYIYDQEEEEIAFLDSLIVPAPKKPQDDTLDLFHEVKLDMYMFKENPKRQILMETKVLNPKQLRVVFKLPAVNPKIELLDNAIQDWKHMVKSDRGDSLLIWIKKDLPDTIHVAVSDDSYGPDTLRLILKKPKKIKRKGKRSLAQSTTKDTKPKMLIKSNASVHFDYFSTLSLYFQHPIVDWKKDKLLLLEPKDSLFDSIWVAGAFRNKEDKRIFDLDYSLKENTSYKLMLPQGYFHDILGQSNDSMEFKANTTRVKDYGNLKLSVDFDDSTHLIIQVYNEKKMLLAEQNLRDSTISFQHLKPGNYIIKAVVDQNKNGKWDTGDYLKHQYPEKVYFMKAPITIRANWDVEQKWILKP